MPPRDTQRFTPSSGRPFAFCRYGARDGRPVIALHGTPGSRLKYAVADEAARRHGLQLIAPDRWGYGETPAVADASLRDFADDIGEFARASDFQDVGIIGISGGGPFAAAAAVGLKERAGALALVAPVAPLVSSHSEEANAPDIKPFHRIAFFATPRVPGLVRLLFGAMRTALHASDDFTIRMVTARAGPSDRRIAREPETASRLASAFREGLRPGLSGPVTDMQIFSRPWNVDLRQISCRAGLWIGDEDRNVPVSAALALARHISQLQINRLPDAGHFWISNHYAEVLDWIANRGAPNLR